MTDYPTLRTLADIQYILIIGLSIIGLIILVFGIWIVIRLGAIERNTARLQVRPRIVQPNSSPQAQSTTIPCTRCGRTNMPEAVYCISCGKLR